MIEMMIDTVKDQKKLQTEDFHKIAGFIYRLVNLVS